MTVNPKLLGALCLVMFAVCIGLSIYISRGGKHRASGTTQTQSATSTDYAASDGKVVLRVISTGDNYRIIVIDSARVQVEGLR